jgi:hypothetical protein
MTVHVADPSEGTTLHNRPCKRRRSLPLPLTPPASPDDRESSSLLDRAVHVLTTEATALSYVSRLYQTDPKVRAGLLNAVEAIVAACENRSKLIVCGVGKSAYVGMKIVATMKSLGIACSFLHAGEALHGDLGDVRSVSKRRPICARNNSLTIERAMLFCLSHFLARPQNWSL